jgi:hypothetical protein
MRHPSDPGGLANASSKKWKKLYAMVALYSPLYVNPRNAVCGLIVAYIAFLVVAWIKIGKGGVF